MVDGIAYLTLKESRSHFEEQAAIAVARPLLRHHHDVTGLNSQSVSAEVSDLARRAPVVGN